MILPVALIHGARSPSVSAASSNGWASAARDLERAIALAQSIEE